MSVGQRRPGAPYHYDFIVGGRRFHSTTTTTNRREALEIEKAAKADAKREAAEAKANAGRVSLQIGHVASAYWEQIGQHHAGSEDTRRLLNLLIKQIGPTTPLPSITHDMVARLVAWRRGHKVPHTGRLISAYTVNDTTEVLKKLFTFTKAQKSWRAILDHEPEWKKLWLKEERERVREVRPDEAAKLDGAIRDDYKPLFDFLLATGVRKSEARTLRWSSVDWGNRQIITTGKGGEKVVVAITPAVRDILWPLRGHHEEFVFTMTALRTRDGKVAGKRYPIGHSGLNTRWRRDRRKAGLSDLRVHDLRHDFATKLLRDCGDIAIVQKALNHKDLRVTQRYAHVLQEDVAAAIEAMQHSRRDKTRKKSTAKPTAKSRRVR
jgi:integrase